VISSYNVEECVESQNINKIKFKLPDVCALVIFIIVSVTFQIFRDLAFTQGFINGSDASNIATFAYARVSPEMFHGDGLLSEFKNFGFYRTIQIPMLIGLYKIFGSFGAATAHMYGLHVFLFLSGFYMLGCLMLNNRALAFLFSTVLIAGTDINWSYWGLGDWDVTPRLTFASTLGFVLSYAYVIKEKYIQRTIFMFIFGFFMFVHPVSAPAIAVSLFLGFALYRPHGVRPFVYILLIFVTGAMFLLGAAPYVYKFLGAGEEGATATVLTNFYEIIKYRLAKNYTDYYGALRNFIEVFFIKYPLFTTAGIVSIISFLMTRKKDILLVLLWSIGPVVALLIYLADQWYAKKFGTPPLEVDMIRGVRFLVPFSLLLIFMGSRHLYCTLSGRLERRNAFALFLALSAVISFFSIMQIINGIDMMRHRYIKTMMNQTVEIVEVLDFIKDRTPAKSLIFSSVVDPLAIRYYAGRPVAFTRKDGGALIYGDHNALYRWYQTSKENDAAMKSIRKGDVNKGMDMLTVLAQRFRSDYLIIESKWLDGYGLAKAGTVVYCNKKFSIIKLIKAGT